MQKVQLSFPTQINSYNFESHKKSVKLEFRQLQYSNQKNEFLNHINQFDNKINTALANQKKQLKIKKYDLENEISQVKKEQSKLIKYLKSKQNQFQQQYYKFYKYDINKFSEYNSYFEKTFKDFNAKINQKKLYNSKLKIIIESLRTKLKQIMKQNKANQTNKSSYASTIVKGNTQDTDITKVQIAPSEINMRSSSLPRLRSENYLNPIYDQKKIMKQKNAEERISILKLLKNILEFRKTDKKFKQYTWFQQVIFNERVFQKIIMSIDDSLKILIKLSK